MLDPGANIALTRVVLRVLVAVQDEAERTEVVRRVLPRVDQFSGREELLDVVGRRKDPNDLLIPQGVAEELLREQNEQVLAADPAQLAKERQLVSLFHRAREAGGDAAKERIVELLSNDAVFLRLLRSALSERRSQSLGDLAVRTTADLPWEGLAEMIGGIEKLSARVSDVASRVARDELDERTRLALETAERFAIGELPERDRFG